MIYALVILLAFEVLPVGTSQSWSMKINRRGLRTSNKMIILFLVDTSASMNQRTYMGSTNLDLAKKAIENFLKIRQRDPEHRYDRVMLMTTDEPPGNVLAGWRDMQSTFSDALRSLRALSPSSLGAALTRCFDYLNANRMRNITDFFGNGRFPCWTEPALIIVFTDGQLLSTATNAESSLVLPRLALGAELYNEPFRWDQSVFSVVLRFPARQVPDSQSPEAQLTLPTDAGPNAASDLRQLCEQTGGRCHLVRTPAQLYASLESVASRARPVFVVQLERPPPPPLVTADPVPRAFHDAPLGVFGPTRCVLLAQPPNRGRQYHWLFPEPYTWAKQSPCPLPPRNAHPLLRVSGEPLPEQLLRLAENAPSSLGVPVDQFELEQSALTEYVIRGPVPPQELAQFAWPGKGEYDRLLQLTGQKVLPEPITIRSNEQLDPVTGPLHPIRPPDPLAMLPTGKATLNPMRNPFDVERAGLVRHVGRLGQAFSRLLRPIGPSPMGSAAPALASSSSSGSAVVTLADLYELAGEAHHEVSMHEMGDYQSFKERQARLPESSSPPLRELDEAPVRLHAFGNPFKVAKGMMVDEAELGGMQLQLSESGERERERVDRLASPNGSRPGPGPGSLAGVRRAGPPPAKRKKGPIPRELSTAQLLRQLREGRAPTAASPIEDEDSAATFSPIIIPLVPEDQQLPAQEPKLIPLEGSPVPSVSDLSTLNASTGSTPDDAEEHSPLDEDLREWSDPTTRASIQKDNEKHLRAIQRLIRNAHGSDLSSALTELRALSGPAFVQHAIVEALIGEARRFKRHALAALIERYRLALNVLL